MPPALHTRDYVPLSGRFDAALQEALLAPIAGERPTGDYLRHEGTYDRIAEARREDDARLDQGVWQREFKRADWVAVAQICGEALELRSKDVQIAAWLTEAWGKLHGFAGVEAGLRLTSALCETYWDGLYPALEDPEHRAAPFHWINEKLAVQLKFIPLTQPSDVAPVTYAWADWEAANRAEQQRLQAAQAKSAATVTPAQIQRAVRHSAPEFLADCHAHLAAVRSLVIGLEEFLDARYPKAGPSLRLFRSTIEEIQLYLGQGPAETEVLAPKSTPVSALAPRPAELSAPVPLEPGGPIQSRREAYQRLAEAAEYLLRTEPHSPTPYLVNRAIRWGNLPLDQLLPELVRNDVALGELQRLLNLKLE